MELSIDYECPACRKIIPRQLNALSLGEARACADCGATAELTAEGLVRLRHRIVELFNH